MEKDVTLQQLTKIWQNYIKCMWSKQLPSLLATTEENCNGSYKYGTPEYTRKDMFESAGKYRNKMHTRP